MKPSPNLNALLQPGEVLAYLQCRPEPFLLPCATPCPICQNQSPPGPIGHAGVTNSPAYGGQEAGVQDRSLWLWQDTLYGGCWARCSVCHFAGDLLELVAGAQEVSLQEALATVTRAGFLGKVELPDEAAVAGALARYQRDFRQKRQNLATLLQENQQVGLARIEALGQRAALQELGVRLPAAGEGPTHPGPLYSVVDCRELEAVFRPRTLNGRGDSSTAGANPVFRGTGWRGAVAVGLEDFPGRLRGVWVYGQRVVDAQSKTKKLESEPRVGQKRARLQPSGGPESFCRFLHPHGRILAKPQDCCGVAFLEQLPAQDRLWGPTVFGLGFLPAALALLEANRYRGKEALPVLGCPLPERGLPGVRPEVLGGRPLILWGDPLSGRFLALARLHQARVCSWQEVPAREWVFQGSGRSWLERIDRQAQPWAHWIEQIFRHQPEVQIRQLLADFGLHEHQREELFEAMGAELSAPARARLDTLIGRPQCPRWALTPQKDILETEQGWFTSLKGAPHGQLTSFRLRFDTEILAGSGRRPRILYRGRLLSGQRSIPFLLPGPLEEDPTPRLLPFLQALCLRAGLPEPYVRVDWLARVVEMARLFQPPLRRDQTGRCGLDPATTSLQLAHYRIGPGGQQGPGLLEDLDPAGYPLAPPDDLLQSDPHYQLAPGQHWRYRVSVPPLEIERTARLAASRPSPFTRGLALGLGILANVLAPLYAQPRRGLILARRAQGMLLEIAAGALGCACWSPPPGESLSAWQAAEFMHDFPLFMFPPQEEPFRLHTPGLGRWLAGPEHQAVLELPADEARTLVSEGSWRILREGSELRSTWLRTLGNLVQVFLVDLARRHYHLEEIPPELAAWRQSLGGERPETDYLLRLLLTWMDWLAQLDSSVREGLQGISPSQVFAWLLLPTCQGSLDSPDQMEDLLGPEDLPENQRASSQAEELLAE